MTEAVGERAAVATDGLPRLGVAPMPRPVELAPPTMAWQVADALLALGLLAAVAVVANLGRMPHGVEEFLTLRLSIKNILLMTAFGLAWPVVLRACGCYAPARLREGRGEWPRLIVASLIACGLAMIFPLTSESHSVRPVHVLIFGALLAPVAAGIRTVARAASRVGRRTGPRQVVLVGSGPIAARVLEAVRLDPVAASEVMGFVDTEPHRALDALGLPHLGGLASLERILMHHVVDEVFIGLPIRSRYEQIQQAIIACERVGVPARLPTDFFRTRLVAPRVEQGGDRAVLALDVAPSDSRLVFKRAMDVAGGAVLLVLLAPLFVVTAIAVKLSSRGPVFFTQERFGYMKRRFRMLKFRTMVQNAEALQMDLEVKNEASGPAFKIRNDPRITTVGRFLRRSSLDELPQLWHVLTGEMSLVGPRPLPVRDVGHFAEPWLMRRFSVRPGLTCLWQISGRSDLGFDRWIALDLEYIDGWSLRLDLEILLRTVPAVLRGRGAE